MSPSSSRPRTGGQGGAEPRARIQQREADAWALDLQGYTQREIADELGISQPAVSKILRRVADRYAQQLLADALRVRARGHAALRFLYRECLAGWERSARDHTRQRQRVDGRRTPGGAHGPAPITDFTVERRAGDPRFLREAREVTVASLQLASQIAGTAPPPPSRTLDLSALSPEELAVIERLVARQQAAMAGQTAPGPGAAPVEMTGEGS